MITRIEIIVNANFIKQGKSREIENKDCLSNEGKYLLMIVKK